MQPTSLHRRWAALSSLLALAALTSACSEEPTITYRGTFLDAADGSPLDGVEICVTQPEGIPCVSTDASGAYVLEGLPIETRIVATATRTSYLSINAAFVTRDADLELDAVMLQSALVQAAFTAGGLGDLDLRTRGAVLVRAYDPAIGFTSSLGGITGEIAPMSGDGPFYNDEASIDPTATATVEGSGTWFLPNVEPGTYQVRSTSAERSCPGTFHWSGSNGAGWLEAPVRAGFVTYFYVDCPAP